MTKRNQDFSKDILSLIRSSVSPAVLSERLQDFHENDLAEVLRELSAAGAADYTVSWKAVCWQMF